MKPTTLRDKKTKVDLTTPEGCYLYLDDYLASEGAISDVFDALETLHSAAKRPELEPASRPLMSQPFQPLTITVDVNTLRNIKDALDTGEQYARDALTEHDSSLGRTTLKNKRWAESIETDIGKLADLSVILENLIADH